MGNQKRDYLTFEHSNTVKESFFRFKQTCTQATLDNYLTRFISFCRSEKNKSHLEFLTFKEAVRSLLKKQMHKWENSELRYSTIKQYRSSIIWGISLVATYYRDDSLDYISPQEMENLTELYKLFAGDDLLTEIDMLYQESTQAFFANSSQSQINERIINAKKGKERTSSNRAKSVVSDLSLELDKYTPQKKYDELFKYLKLFLTWNSVLGLRPSEWKSVELSQIVEPLITSETVTINNQIISTHVLKIKNCKSSHGRACGTHRILELNLNHEQFTEIEQLKNFIQNERNFLKKAQDLLLQFKVNLKDINPISPVLKRNICLYSTRHQAIANAKKQGYSPIEIAAMFGHISIDTNSLHYGKKKDGKSSSDGGVVLKPSIENLNIVNQALTPNQRLKLGNQTVEGAIYHVNIQKNNLEANNEVKKPSQNPSNNTSDYDFSM